VQNYLAFFFLPKPWEFEEVLIFTAEVKKEKKKKSKIVKKMPEW
jgi:hypothetical protein